MADTPNNPAARLLALVQAAQRLSHGQSVREVWSTVFEIDVHDTSTLLRRLASLRELPDEAAAAVRTLPGKDHEHALRWKGRIDSMVNALASNIDAQWHGAVTMLDDVTMYSLDGCARELSLSRPEPSLDPAEVVDLHRLVRELIEEVLNGALEPEMKSFLLEHLRAADEALQEYRLWGVQSVEKALAKMAGRAMSQQPVAKRAAETAEGKRFTAVLKRLAKGASEGVRTAAAVIDLYTFSVTGQLPLPIVQQLLAGPAAIEAECVEVLAESVGPGSAAGPSDVVDGDISGSDTH